MDQADDAWREYQNSGPVFFHETVAREVVIAVWSLDLFVDGLQARSRSSIKSVLANGINLGQIDPNIRVEDLSPNKRAMIWRHLYTSNTADMVNLLPPQYARVKEILESLEVFRHIEKLLRRRGNTTYGNIYDVGCGHGLVGMLCAAAYPHIRVQCIDRVPRESFQAQRTAFEASGMSLDNLHFVTGDLTVLEENVLHAQNNNNSGIKDNSGSLLLCVHGCKSLTHESIELACSNNWSWLSLPCCLQAEHHLDASMKVKDDTRFGILCGAIAAKYKADSIAEIDSRITGRGIVLSFSGKC